MYLKTTFDNGLRVLTSPMPHTRSVSICFFIGVGSRYEDDSQAGISHFVEHLLFKGTTKRPTSRDISESIEGVGGMLNAGTDKEMTVYWCKVASYHFAAALDVLADMMLHSRFDPGEIERERKVIMEEINLTLDVPSQRADMLIDELLWNSHPLGREIAGSKETVAGISRSMLLGYLASQYQPSNTVLAIAGNIAHDETVAAVERAMGGWKNTGEQRRFVPFEEHPAPRVRVETRDTEQTHVCLGLPGLSLLHPRRFALDMLNIILGEGMSSRLFTEIRDRLGLAYGVSSFVDHFYDSGSLTVYAGVEPSNLPAAVRAIIAELARFREPVPPAELAKARELSKGRLMLRMEDSRSVAGWLGGQEILLGKILTLDDMLRVIDSVTADEIIQVAGDVIRGDKLRMAVVGPIPGEDSLEELLRMEQG